MKYKSFSNEIYGISCVPAVMKTHLKGMFGWNNGDLRVIKPFGTGTANNAIYENDGTASAGSDGS